MDSHYSHAHAFQPQQPCFRHSVPCTHIDKLTAFLGSPPTLLWQAERSHHYTGTKNGSAATANQCELSKVHTQLAAQHARPKPAKKSTHRCLLTACTYVSRLCSISPALLLSYRCTHTPQQQQPTRTGHDTTAATASGGRHTTWPLLQKMRWLGSGPCYSVPLPWGGR